MNSEIDIFLRAFFAGLNGEKIELSDSEIAVVADLARANHVLAIAYMGIKRPSEMTQTYSKIRTEMMADCSRQAIMDDIFSRFAKELEANSIDYCVLKGPAIAQYYTAPDMRVSTDFDILIKEEQLESVKGVIENFGGTINESMSDEKCIHAIFEQYLHLELHMKIFSGGTLKGACSVDELLREENLERIGTGVITLKPQQHLLYLIYHTVAHFVNAGCGIRQLADCWIYANANKDRIDFELLSEKLRERSVAKFAKTVFLIGVNYCNLDKQIINAFDDDVSELVEPILKDSVEGGSFGHANAERAATTTVTTKKNMSILNAVFPPLDYLKKRYPECEKNRLLIPVAWCKRIVQFLKKSGKKNPIQAANKTIQIAHERMRLIDRMGIYGNSHSNVQQTSEKDFINDVENLFKNGNEVRLRISGISMTPFLKHGRDYVILNKFDGNPVKGDIYFYQRNGSKPVMHRLIKIKEDKLYMCGDSQLVLEEIKKEMIFASAVRFVVDGKPIKKKSAKYLFYSKIWRNIRLRKIAFKVIKIWKKIRDLIKMK